MGEFDVAQVCRSGHVANPATRRAPEFNKSHCNKCGEDTITACPECKAEIQGSHFEGEYSQFYPKSYHLPAYCHKCGKAFPWTDLKMQAAIELAVESGKLTEEEERQFREGVSDIARDTPRARLAGSRLYGLITKTGKETAVVLRELLVDIASEAVKKIIWPDKK